MNYKTIDTPIDIFLNDVLKHQDLADKYKQKFDQLSLSHRKYRGNWRVNFFNKHRYINWILYSFFTNYKNKDRDDLILENAVFDKNFTVYDIGCYDSYLVSLLRKSGIKAYGYDDNDWAQMFSLLETEEYINSNLPNIDVCLVLNYAHNFTPESLFSFIEEKCLKLPEILFFDFGKSVSHIHQHIYYKDEIIKKYDFKIFNFSDHDERDLFVWQKK